MQNPESILEQIYFTTVRIESVLSDQSKQSGTCFFFQYDIDDMSHQFIVTNKHVVEDAEHIKFSFTKKKNGAPSFGDIFKLLIPNSSNKWIYHQDKDIDIAILPFSHLINEINEKTKDDIYFRSINPDLVPSDDIIKNEIDAIEDIIFVGYPNDVYDTKNLLPVVRKGITATPLSIEFENKPIFLIDASIFPGSSGSPVFLCNIGSYQPKGGRLKAGNRVFFLGIVSSVFIKRDLNTLELIDVPTQKTPVVESSQMIDLGIVFKSKLILELIEKILGVT